MILPLVSHYYTISHPYSNPSPSSAPSNVQLPNFPQPAPSPPQPPSGVPPPVAAAASRCGDLEPPPGARLEWGGSSRRGGKNMKKHGK